MSLYWAYLVIGVSIIVIISLMNKFELFLLEVHQNIIEKKVGVARFEPLLIVNYFQ